MKNVRFPDGQRRTFQIFMFQAWGGSDIFYQKLLYICLMPYAVLAATALAWLSYKLVFKKQILEKMLASMIIIVFILQPSLVKIVFQAMSCLTLENGPNLIKRAPYLLCYDETHVKWIIFLYIPTLLIWILIFPLFALSVIHRNRKQLDTPRMKLKYLFLYNGYTSDRYYWEFITMYRKILMGLIVVFISDQLLFLKCMLLLMLLFLSILLQVRCRPYIKNELNQVDLTATTVSVVTLYAGIFYVIKVPEENEAIFFIILILANVGFLVRFGITLFQFLYKTTSDSPEMKAGGPLTHDAKPKLSYSSVATEKNVAHQLDISLQNSDEMLINPTNPQDVKVPISDSVILSREGIQPHVTSLRNESDFGTERRGSEDGLLQSSSSSIRNFKLAPIKRTLSSFSKKPRVDVGDGLGDSLDQMF
eukprot:TRINITY_DN10321_c0_g1_i2.p1 TRINITY_DN10321_c0_g1~~TRINITY_DN10321_c0_g1_i2.p1  ORF type:complete len:420 (+),score=-3.46 TRINITY_DN10321_c0_g1_i2:125-1384(+)